MSDKTIQDETLFLKLSTVFDDVVVTFSSMPDVFFWEKEISSIYCKYIRDYNVGHKRDVADKFFIDCVTAASKEYNLIVEYKSTLEFFEVNFLSKISLVII